MAQLALAVKYDLPVSFHVREAFADFWPIVARFPGLRGTLHSYTGNMADLDKALSMGLYISLNGIVTFNQDKKLQQVYNSVPLDRILLETDAPYLTPAPHRGTMNTPAYVADIVRFVAKSRGCETRELAAQTTNHATELFSLR
jgi:TatD DNase family protein